MRHVKHFARHVVILIRLGFLLVYEYVASFSSRRVDGSSDHVLSRRWPHLPQTLKITRHRGNWSGSHALTSLRSLLQALIAKRAIISVKN